MKVAIDFSLLGSFPQHSNDQTLLIEGDLLIGLGPRQSCGLVMAKETTLGELREDLGMDHCPGYPADLKVWFFDSDTDGSAGEGFSFTLAELEDLKKLA